MQRRFKELIYEIKKEFKKKLERHKRQKCNENMRSKMEQKWGVRKPL